MNARARIEDGMLRVGPRLIPFIAGEIQFWRMDPETWRPTIRAARDSGVTIVSTYLSWRRHEPRRGEIDFDGEHDPRLDVRRFLQICAELGVLVQLKPGPWICAEEPGGGYPDWLLQSEDLLARDDNGEVVVGYNPPFLHPVPSYTDPDYLAAVRGWFGSIWHAVGDQFHPNGPIIALQLDNEPSSCFQDSLYGADYSASSVEAFRHWLRLRYEDDSALLRTAWDDAVDFETAEPPRRPDANAPRAHRQRIHDWIEYKTFATGDYLATLRAMHTELGGGDLLYTVNLVTHPIHDVPVAHSAIREAVDASTGEDHYYIPPLDTSDIHRLARSAATARCAGEPLPWVPELQAGIWRSPGEEVGYPDPTPLEQELWWGAAIALGFAGANLYMLADRENWEYSPLTTDAQPSPFFRPVEKLVALVREHPAAVTAPVCAPVTVLWHRPDAYDAYAVTGTARVPEVEWHDGSDSAYRAWEDTLEELTRRGIPYDLWDTATELDASAKSPILVPHRTGVDQLALEHLRASGRVVIRLDENNGGSTLDEMAATIPRLTDASGSVDRSLVALRPAADGTIVHLVHWGDGEKKARLVLPGVDTGSLRALGDGTLYPVVGGEAALSVAPGHRVFVLAESTSRSIA